MRKTSVGSDGSLVFLKNFDFVIHFCFILLFLLCPASLSADEMDWNDTSSVLLHVADKIDSI